MWAVSQLEALEARCIYSRLRLFVDCIPFRGILYHASVCGVKRKTELALNTYSTEAGLKPT